MPNPPLLDYPTLAGSGTISSSGLVVSCPVFSADERPFREYRINISGVFAGTVSFSFSPTNGSFSPVVCYNMSNGGKENSAVSAPQGPAVSGSWMVPIYQGGTLQITGSSWLSGTANVEILDLGTTLTNREVTKRWRRLGY